MQRAYIHLIDYFLNKDYSLNISNGRDFGISCDFKKAKEMIESCDDARVFIMQGDEIVSLAVINASLAPRDSVIDHSQNEPMQQWLENYHRLEGLTGA